MDTSAPRVRIFIDFWNFQLSWNQYHARKKTKPNPCKIPWDEALPNALVRQVDPLAKYVGTHVYASINPQGSADRGLAGFLNIMDGFPGYKVIVKERRPGSPVKCTSDACRQEIPECPKCHEPLKRTVEKGIDASLLTDLIKSAFDNTFDHAILITEDSDFVPAVDFIQERWTKRIVHAFFKGKSHELRNACWQHIFIDDFMPELLRTPTEKAQPPTKGH